MTRITDTKIDGRLAGTSRRQGNAASLVSVGRPRHSNKSRVSPPFIALLLVFVTSAVFGATIEAGFDKPGAFYIDTEPPPANATKVIVGLYAMNCYEMLPLSNTYWFTGYLFFRWTDRNYDPTTDFELNNLVQTVDGTIKQITQGIKILPSNESYLEFYIQGRFYQPFNLKNFPLDKQHLSVNVENQHEPRSQVVYIPDSIESSIDSTFAIPGWNVVGISAKTMVHDYNSNFGQTGADEEELFSAVHFSVEITRAQNFFVWKFLLPLVLILISNWLTLLLHPKYVEVRTAICASALLTVVFLQQGSLEASTSGLVLMDEIFVIAYFLIVVTFALVVWDNNSIQPFLASEREVAYEEELLMETVDRKSRRAELVELKEQEKKVVSKIKLRDGICLAFEMVAAIISITTLAVVQSGQPT